MRKIKQICFLFSVVSLLLTGCGESENIQINPQEVVADQNLTHNLEPDFQYSRPVEQSNVLVNKTGYMTGSSKIAIFLGDRIPETYEIVEKESGEAVFRGNIQTKADGTSIGNFSEWKTPGTYYLRCDLMGCSDFFTIDDDLYTQAAEKLKQQMLLRQENNDVDLDTLEICKNLSYLLVNYEIYPEQTESLWGDELLPYMKKEVEWLLSMQDSKSGGIYSGIKHAQGKLPVQKTEGMDESHLLKDITEESTAAFVGTMAKFSYMYQQTDVTYATTCLRAASMAWHYLEKAAVGKTEEELKTAASRQFYGAAELFRASNGGQYHYYIRSRQEDILYSSHSFFYDMGRFTYLSTRRKVDAAICGNLMGQLLKEAEDISGQARANTYLVETEDKEELLQNMMSMAIVDYIITNYEYSTVIENHLHYMLGRNEKRQDLTQVLQESDMPAFMLMLFDVLADKEELSN